MPTYQYVNNSGAMSTINANTANEAIANASDRESSSGVALIPTPQGSSTTPTPPQSGVITPSNLQTQQPIQVPQPTPSVPPAPSTQPTLAQNLLSSFDLNANEQAATNTQENLVAKMLDNINNLAGESAYRTQVTNESGIGQKRQELVNLNSQILQKQAEIQQSDIQLISNMRAEERRDTLLPFAQNAQAKLAGDAQILRALKTSEIGVLNALALGKQGDIQLAKDTINEAVDAKFAPYKEQNAVYEAQLKAIQPFLDKAEKKQAAAQQVKVSLAMKEIEKQELREKDVQKLIIDAVPNAPASVISNAQSIANKGGSTIEVAQALGKYAGDYLGDAIKRASLSKTNMEINKLAEEIKASKVAIDTQSLPNTTNGFVTKLMVSAKNTKDLDASERQSLAKARTVVGQLDTLQSNIAKQNKTGFIKGKVNNFKESFGLNADVGTINAQLQAIVPNLARGTYGEVGVLTDSDIANYRKTLPRLDRPTDQNDAVMALTLKTVLNSMENTLSGAANSNINVAGWTQDYLNIKNQINTIEDRIGVSKEAVNSLIAKDPTIANAVKEMYQSNLSDREILEALNSD